MLKPKSKLIGECTSFWNAAYKLINEDRIFPAGENGISAPIDEMYELTITNEWAMLRYLDTKVMCAKMRKDPTNRESLLPYFALLLWYLKKKNM